MHRKRVLVVDDDEDGRDLMSTVLVTAGFRVDTAANGRLALLALELMAEGEPALIILDVMMPVMSGPEVLRVLHDTGRLSSLSVIVLSATPELAHGLGARAIVRKPVHLATLVALVHKHAAEPATPS